MRALSAVPVEEVTPAVEPSTPPSTQPPPPPPPPPPPVEEPVEKPEIKEVKLPVLEDIFFDFDKSTIKSEFRRTLENNARQLKDAPESSITIEGHCDERGTNAYNMALGERRSKAAKDYLVSLGIPASRITTISYGEERP
ncbi:MAG: OmpA family protein, partial [Deltaproteobacteria bacterium]